MREQKVLSTEEKFHGHILNLRIDAVEMPDGRKTTREIIEHEPCIVVIAIDDDANLLLVRQYRRAVDRELLELPAGGIEPGEDPVDAVKREMAEETGYMPQTVIKLGGFYSAPGFCTEYLHFYLATALVAKQLYAEDTDEINVVPVSIDKAADMVMSHEICDSKSIAGILFYTEYLRRKKIKV